MCDQCADVDALPQYVSKATPGQREQSLKILEGQLRNILDQQHAGVSLANATIQCVCKKKALWKYMFRCLYCGIWFCRECAQLHFGYRIK